MTYDFPFFVVNRPFLERAFILDYSPRHLARLSRWCMCYFSDIAPEIYITQLVHSHLCGVWWATTSEQLTSSEIGRYHNSSTRPNTWIAHGDEVCGNHDRGLAEGKITETPAPETPLAGPMPVGMCEKLSNWPTPGRFLN